MYAGINIKSSSGLVRDFFGGGGLMVMGTDIRTRGVCMHNTISLGPMNVRVTEQHLKAYDSHAITILDGDSTKNLELSTEPII
jgi:hypothetical protein